MKWLGEIVIGTGIEAGFFVLDFFFAGQHNYRRQTATLPVLTEDRQSVLARKGPVHDDQIVIVEFETAGRLFAVAGQVDSEIPGSQEVACHVCQGFFIFDYEYLRHRP